MRAVPILAAALLSAAAAAPAGAKTLVFCSEGDPTTLNPQFATTTTAMNAGRPIFDTLIGLETGSLRVVPGLAESWTISDDGRTYILRLRAGVAFHANEAFKPTRPMNAEDVVFSLHRQWKEDHPFHALSGGRYDYFKDLGMPDLLEEVAKVDDRTVRIRIKRPDATFLPSLGMPFNVVLSAEYAAYLDPRGPQGRDRFRADRNRPVQLRRLPEGRRHPLPRLPGLLGGTAADRHARLLHHAQPGRPSHQAEGRRGAT